MKRIGMALVGLAIALSGCATVTKGTSQLLDIGSQPAGADCVLMREGETLGSVKTPGSITVKRGAKAINVVCKMDGYEEARAVMNSQGESATYGNFIVGGVVGMAIDSASGASSRYEPSLMVALTPMSPADQAAAALAAARPKTPPVPSVPTAVAPPSGTGPYDGQYDGSVALAQTDLGQTVLHRRQFDVRVVGGVGVGTAKHPLCDQAGEVRLTIDALGGVNGTANTQNTTGCTQRMSTLEGRVDGDKIRLSLLVERRREPVDFLLSRKPGASLAGPAAAPPSSGPFDGDYRGGIEVGSGDLRQIWIRIQGGKATGTSTLAVCRKPGGLVMTVDPSGVVRGEFDLLKSSCDARKAQVTGRIEGNKLMLTLAFDDGSKSREFTFARQSRGAGVSAAASD